MKHYFICDYCGNYKTKRSTKKIPKCNCKEGNGKTFMRAHNKETFPKWKKNKQ